MGYIHLSNALYRADPARWAELRGLLPEAVIGREARDYGGVRALVKRGMVPETLALERPTVEEIILFIVKGENGR